MAVSEPVNLNQKQAGLAIASFGLGLTTLIFPVISVFYLVTVHGGAGYEQSLVCGIPFAGLSVIAGIVALVQGRKNDQAGRWMAISGIVLGCLFFGFALILEFILLYPFLSGNAH